VTSIFKMTDQRLRTPGYWTAMLAISAFGTAYGSGRLTHTRDVAVALALTGFIVFLSAVGMVCQAIKSTRTASAQQKPAGAGPSTPHRRLTLPGPQRRAPDGRVRDIRSAWPIGVLDHERAHEALRCDLDLSNFTEVLASLLPGLRDLRTPLTVGYLWLICVWLWFGDVLPRRATARGPIANLYALGGILPSAASLAALTFMAYFLGSIVELNIASARWLDAVRPNRTAWEAVADRFRIRLDDRAGVTPERYAEALAAWQRAAPARTHRRVMLESGVEWERVRPSDMRPADGDGITQHSKTYRYHGWPFHKGGYIWRRDPGAGTPPTGLVMSWRAPQLPLAEATFLQLPTLAMLTLYALQDELPDLATRLLIERTAVFDRYDRLLAEASIRINMFLPVGALVATLALRTHWLWWLGLIVCAALLYQGLVQRSRALSVVLDSVATRLIESPTMVAVTAAQHGEGAVSAPLTAS
jgi:hypothetical protein